MTTGAPSDTRVLGPARRGEVDAEALARCGELRERLAAAGVEPRALDRVLLRLLACVCADDLERSSKVGPFRAWLDATAADGSDLGPRLERLFRALGASPRARRGRSPPLRVDREPFAAPLPIPRLDRGVRDALIDACSVRWRRVDATVFGALLESTMHPRSRRGLGAHYTRREIVARLIGPLLVDELRGELERARRDVEHAERLLARLRRIALLDPACGCGDFLVVAYRELASIELELLASIGAPASAARVGLEQLHGLELDERAAQVARLALWLTDRQLDRPAREDSDEHRTPASRDRGPRIIRANALAVDWREIAPRDRELVVLGNPPFVGKQRRTRAQRDDLARVCGSMRGFRVLDYAAAWFVAAARLLRGGDGRCAFVATNSIAQGQQVGVLWSELARLDVELRFAHRAFAWSSDARDAAAVHCVILGFGASARADRRIYEVGPSGATRELAAKRINPYLVDAPTVLLRARPRPIGDVPPIDFGSMPNDGGHLSLDEAERAELLGREPAARRWIRRFVGAEEFLHRIPRWCLWLAGITADELRALPAIAARVEAVRAHRAASRREGTRRLAAVPTSFGEVRQPDSRYLLIPSVSSARRDVIPLDFMPREVVASNLVFVMPGAELAHFGVLSSAMHMAWVRHVAGRLKSDLRYSKDIVYGNFPWPRGDRCSPARLGAIEAAARAVLEARASFGERTLAELYEPTATPDSLARAHRVLDRAVDDAYRARRFADDAERVAWLFELHRTLADESDRGARRKPWNANGPAGQGEAAWIVASR